MCKKHYFISGFIFHVGGLSGVQIRWQVWKFICRISVQHRKTGQYVETVCIFTPATGFLTSVRNVVLLFQSQLLAEDQLPSSYITPQNMSNLSQYERSHRTITSVSNYINNLQVGFAPRSITLLYCLQFRKHFRSGVSDYEVRQLGFCLAQLHRSS